MSTIIGVQCLRGSNVEGLRVFEDAATFLALRPRQVLLRAHLSVCADSGVVRGR